MGQKSDQNYINHIALVLDASSSMAAHEKRLVEVADEQIAYLAQRSKELDQETRITVYTFADTAKCVIYDKDVLRLPSIAALYRPNGMTALIDATNLALDDLALTPEKYGDHSFLVFVLTDGYENASTGSKPTVRNSMIMPTMRHAELRDDLANRLKNLPDHWSVATFVPDQRGVEHAKHLGFPVNNVAIWDATSTHGVEEAVSVMRTATDTYMTNRAQGIRGSRSLFVGGQVDAKAIKAAGLKPLPNTARQIVHVSKTTDAFEKEILPANSKRAEPVKGWFVEIEKFVNVAHPPYLVGRAYYQLVKAETIQGDKAIAVMEKATNKVYVGDAARQLLGLPDTKTRVKPEDNKEYEIFVQSSSVNRHLPIGTQVLLLTG